jgi:hypothetical protein
MYHVISYNADGSYQAHMFRTAALAMADAKALVATGLHAVVEVIWAPGGRWMQYATLRPNS